MAGQNVVTITDDNFDLEVVQSSVPVLVDFWAPWCGPCKMIAPILDEIATERAGTTKIAKVNVDESPNIAAKFGIQSIPTLIFFKNGQKVEQMVGARGKKDLIAKLDALA
jgi:thioredoxin 1